MVIKAGEYGANAFLVQSGTVRVYAMQDEKEVPLAILETGQIFGEMALIFDGPRTASVQAVQDCNLIVITRQQFKDKLKSTDPTIRAVVNMLAARILDTNNSLVSKKNDLKALKETGRIIYQNIAAGLSKPQQRVFQATILPKLEALIEAVDAFEDRYGDLDDD